MKLNRILLDPASMLSGGGGGTPPAGGDWRASLPEDIRSSPSLAKYTSVAELAKGHVNAESLIGAKRLAAPTDKWGEQDWNNFYKELGRPETPDAYKLPEGLKLPEGVTLDEEKMKKANAALHKAGLTPKQHNAVMSYYSETLGEAVTGEQQKSANSMAEGMNALRGEWGERLDHNLDIAKSVIKKFGDADGKLIQELEKSGFANNPTFIKSLHAIGVAMLDDKAVGGGGGGLDMMDSTRALREIDSLKIDGEFQKAFQDGRHPGHAAAVARWMELHKAAHPGTQQN